MLPVHAVVNAAYWTIRAGGRTYITMLSDSVFTWVVSVSIAEEEVGGIGVENLVGQLTAWNYYQTVDTPVNAEFVAAFKERFGENRVTLRGHADYAPRGEDIVCAAASALVTPYRPGGTGTSVRPLAAR